MAATKHVLADGDISRPLKKSRIGAAMDTTADAHMSPERNKRKQGKKVKEARPKEKADLEAVSKASSPINKKQMSEVWSNLGDSESNVTQEKAAKKKREKGEKDKKTEKKVGGKKIKKKRKESTEESDNQVCCGTEVNREKRDKAAHKKAKKDVKHSNRLPKVDFVSPDGTVSPSIERANNTNKARKIESHPRLDAELTTRNYVQTISLSNVPKADIDSFVSINQIVITDPRTANHTLRPVTEFYHLPSTNLLEKKPSPFANYQAPTPIQAASWPFTLSGRDVVGVAETGSGKTMAFALPCVESVSAISHKGIKAVIVSPTRELAMQTHAQLEQLASLVKLSSVCLYGGSSKDDQRLRLQRGCDIVVATPGRLKDFMSDGTVELSRAVFVVLDEADRMLDKGFEDDIKQILGSCPARQERQTLMFTATWPQSVQALASTFMTDPVKISIGVGGKDCENGAVELQANTRITQQVEVVDPRDKEFRLLQILKQHQQGKQKNDRILVFCLYKKEATRVENFLSRKGFRVCGIHGDLRQEQRTRSLEAFKSGITPILVATDVAARGLDIPEVKLVVNVTFPLTIEDYVHRIGRTGRAGNFGEAITLFTVQDKAHSGSLINILKGANQPVPDDLLKFGTTVKKKTHEMYGSFFKEVDMSQKATKITFD